MATEQVQEEQGTLHGRYAREFEARWLRAGAPAAEPFVPRSWSKPSRSLPELRRGRVGHVPQRGGAATKGARLCPEDQAQRVDIAIVLRLVEPTQPRSAARWDGRWLAEFDA
jgi:hypothetical protein